jgi:hypothetical protein
MELSIIIQSNFSMLQPKAFGHRHLAITTCANAGDSTRAFAGAYRRHAAAGSYPGSKKVLPAFGSPPGGPTR